MAQAAFEAQLWGQAQQYLHELHNQYGDTQEVCLYDRSVRRNSASTEP